MITITRRLAQQIKSVFRQALRLSFRKGMLPAVQLATGPQGLRIRCQFGQAAAEYRLAGARPQQSLEIAFQMLTEMEGSKEIPIEIASRHGNITASWREGSVPQLIQYDAPAENPQSWPPLPENFAENPPSLLQALHEAAQTTDDGSARYALGCLLLRGALGELIATDGRQALLQTGFNFPWEGDVLVPASQVCGNRYLPAEPVFVGRADDWAVLRVGNWTFWQKIDTEGRFPDVSSQFRNQQAAVANCRISATDGKFLVENLPRLPANEEHNAPVTMELNGTVAVRGKQAGQESCTELVLSGSTRSGENIRFNTDRRYLQRAAQLGFTSLHIFGKESPALATGPQGQYLWALLESNEALAAEDVTFRIESEKGPTAQSVQNPPPQRRTEVPAKRTSHSTETRPKLKTADQEPSDPIAAALKLRDSLRQTLQETSALIHSLKRNRKRTKAVESTLLSLRQLQAIDV